MNEPRPLPSGAAAKAIFEQWRTGFDWILAKYAGNTQRSIESFKTGNAAGREALKAIFLINGGGAVVMLAFMGNLASAAARPEVFEFEQSPSLFHCGRAQSMNLFFLNSALAKPHIPKPDLLTPTATDNPSSEQPAVGPRNWKRVF